MPEYQPNKILYFESELRFMAAYVLNSPNQEIGGDLFGGWSNTGCPILKRAIGPGKEARMDPYSFFQDVSFLKESGTHLIRNYGLQHIGQWHSHHQLNLSEPSKHDDETIVNAMQSYGIFRFILCLFNLLDSQTLSLNAYIYETGHPRRVLPWACLGASQSPYRSLVLNGESEPEQISWSEVNVKMPRTTLNAPLYERLDCDVGHWFMQKKGQAFMQRLSEWGRSASVPVRWSLIDKTQLCLYMGEQEWILLTGDASCDFERFKALVQKFFAVEKTELNAILASFEDLIL